MTKFGKDLIGAMEQALAHARGDDTAGAVVREIEVEQIDVKAIRMSLGLTQDQAAALLGISTSGLRKWEQGQRQPNGAARTLLKIMDKEPDAVMRAISA